MSFLTSWAFWVIVAVIIVIMAIIGYLAEGTELDSKSKKKQKEEKQKPNKVEEVQITEENNEPSAWTGEIKKDERHEQIHDVPSMDDWTNIPTDIQTVEPVQAVEENPKEQLFSEMTPNSTVPNIEPINPQVLENLDAPLTDAPVAEVTKTTEENVQTIAPTPVDVAVPIVEEPNANIQTPAPENLGIESIEEVQPVQETINSQQQLIEPAPIFDAPVVEPAPMETLDVPEETKKETNEENIWK